MMIRLLAIACLGLTVGCGQETAQSPGGDATSAEATPAEPTQAAAAPPAGLERRPSPEGAMAYIIAPTDGATVENPVRILFGLKGAGVVPAGIEREGAGHHHLLIDTGLPDLNLPIPSDENHRHFGGGQTETELELDPGSHTLRLLLGDERHVPHDPPIMSETITVEVR